MSDVKHTPGPWFVDEDADGVYIGPRDGKTGRVEAVVFQLTPFRHEAMRANAELAAASPDLLESAKDLAAQWEAFEASSGNMEEAYYKLAKYARQEWEAMLAAIAKAEGRT